MNKHTSMKYRFWKNAKTADNNGKGGRIKLSLNVWGTQTQSKTWPSSGDKNVHKLISGMSKILHNQKFLRIAKMNPYEFCDLWITSAPQPPSQNKWFSCFWPRLLTFLWEERGPTHLLEHLFYVAAPWVQSRFEFAFANRHQIRWNAILELSFLSMMLVLAFETHFNKICPQ